MSASSCCNVLLRRARSSFLTCRVMISGQETLASRNKSKSTTDVTPYHEDETSNPNAPIRFSTSRAAQWKAQYKAIINDPQILEDEDDAFRRAMYSLAVCMFIIYAFARGKNEWDDEMAMPLGKRMLSLREYQARNELQAAIANKEDTSEIKLQLENIAKLRKEYNYD